MPLTMPAGWTPVSMIDDWDGIKVCRRGVSKHVGIALAHMDSDKMILAKRANQSFAEAESLVLKPCWRSASSRRVGAQFSELHGRRSAGGSSDAAFATISQPRCGASFRKGARLNQRELIERGELPSEWRAFPVKAMPFGQRNMKWSCAKPLCKLCTPCTRFYHAWCCSPVTSATSVSLRFTLPTCHHHRSPVRWRF